MSSFTFEQASRHPRTFHRLTSLTVGEFQILAKKLFPEWQRREEERLSRPDRKRAIGQGRPYRESFATRLLLAVMYVRTATGGALLSCLFGIDEVTMRNWRRLLLPLIQDRFLPDTAVRGRGKRINDLDAFLRVYPELNDIIADGVEFKIQRPKRKQGKNYTGKSKRHVKKIVVAVNRADKLFLGRSKTRPGAVHDKRILEEDPMHRRLNQRTDIAKRADSAWTGEDPQRGWMVNRRGRRNHPLSVEEKHANRRLSKIRIGVEHAIRRLKVFRRLAETAVIRAKGMFDMVVNASMNLANFKELMRAPSRT